MFKICDTVFVFIILSYYKMDFMDSNVTNNMDYTAKLCKFCTSTTKSDLINLNNICVSKLGMLGCLKTLLISLIS